jgi:hypothetical protein
MDRLQAAQENKGVKAMALSRSFKDTVKARVECDPEFRDYINATVGFDQLSEAVAMDPKNLMRMFGPRGNPRLANLSAVLRELTHNGSSGTAFLPC